MPSATICARLTRQYGGDADMASKAVMLSTLLSAVTLPLICAAMLAVLA